MLSKKHRLHAQAHISFSQSATTPFFTIRIKKNGLPYNRYGFVISKRVDKRAVARNSCKRRLGRCIQNLKDQIVQGYDMLFIAKKLLAALEQDGVCRSVEEVLKKQGLLV